MTDREAKLGEMLCNNPTNNGDSVWSDSTRQYEGGCWPSGVGRRCTAFLLLKLKEMTVRATAWRSKGCINDDGDDDEKKPDAEKGGEVIAALDCRSEKQARARARAQGEELKRKYKAFGCAGLLISMLFFLF